MKRNLFSLYGAFFRVTVLLVLLFDFIYNIDFFITFMETFSPDYYNVVSLKSDFLYLIKRNYQLFYLFYLILLFFGILGIGRNVTIFLFFILFKIHLFTFPFHSWGDILTATNLFFLSFADSFDYFSIHKSKKQENYVVSNLAFFSIAIHTCFIYFNNSIHKLESDSWRRGYAFYCLLQEYDYFMFKFRIKSIFDVYLVKIMTYIVLLQQLLFIPLVIWKKTRKWIIILSIAIHSFMGISMYLVKFQILFISTYGFFFPNHDFKFISFVKNIFYKCRNL
ncbi:MAG: hypothetical protein H6604_06820 [Flavobacteriales bacterium]|nr:hypothetical protein [Flavobacteriales bacterium]